MSEPHIITPEVIKPESKPHDSNQNEGKRYTSKKFLKSFISGLKKKNNTKVITTLYIGGIAGIAAKSTIAPFERVKILFLVILKFSRKKIQINSLRLGQKSKIHLSCCHGRREIHFPEAWDYLFLARKFRECAQDLPICCDSENFFLICS